MVEQRKIRLPRGILAGTKTTMLEKKRKYEMRDNLREEGMSSN